MNLKPAVSSYQIGRQYTDSADFKQVRLCDNRPNRRQVGCKVCLMFSLQPCGVQLASAEQAVRDPHQYASVDGSMVTAQWPHVRHRLHRFMKHADRIDSNFAGAALCSSHYKVSRNGHINVEGDDRDDNNMILVRVQVRLTTALRYPF